VTARPRRPRLRRPRLTPKLLLVLIATTLLAGGGWLWFRGSSFVSVQRVSVTGVRGPDAGQIRRALDVAARNMTTLDVSMSELRTAVAAYPVVKDVRVSTQFPHAIVIRVIEQIPVAAVVVGGQTIAVASDGTLLRDAAGAGSLPRIPLSVPPGGTRLTGSARDEVSLLAAAPYRMLPDITRVTTNGEHGLTAELRNGPALYFGDAGQLTAKWTAALAVISDSTSAGAVYIDVSDPDRPAAGGGATVGTAVGSSTVTPLVTPNTVPVGG
jgi:cell division protein FtsQ